MKVYVVSENIRKHTVAEPELLMQEKEYECLNDFVRDLIMYDLNDELVFVRKVVKESFCEGRDRAELILCGWYGLKQYKWTFEVDGYSDTLHVYEQIQLPLI